MTKWEMGAPVPGSTARLWLLGSLLAFVTGAWLLRGSAAGLLLTLGSLAAAGWAGAALVHPWLGPRVLYRVRYHAPAASTLSPTAIGQGLGALARHGGAIALVWRRQGGALALFVEVPASVDEALQGMLPQLLPGAKLEAVPHLPPLASPKGFYRCPLSTAGAGGPSDPLDFTNLPDEAVQAGDLELRVHIVAGGGCVLVHDTPGREASQSRLCPILRPFWRCGAAHVSSRLATAGSNTGQSVANPESRAGILGRLLRPQASTTRIPWSMLLFRRYPFWERWPQLHPHSAAKSHIARGPAVVPPISFPSTGSPTTCSLDSEAAYTVPLPSDYAAPAGGKTITLGVATAGGRAIALSLEHPEWSRHFLAVGGASEDRLTTVERMAAQATDLGVGVVLLDPEGSHVRRVAAQLHPATRCRRAWVDMENPAGSLRLNLLSVPPILGRPTPEAAEAAALVCALEDYVPLLGVYLRHLGAGSLGHSGENGILLDWARLLLAIHHRARLAGDGHQRTATPAPDLRTLYEVLASQDTFPALLRDEARRWAAPDVGLRDALDCAGADGDAALAAVQETLETMHKRLSTMSQSDRRLAAVCLRDHLRSSMQHAALTRLWHGPFEAPATILDRIPGPVLLARLPVHRVAATDAAAARQYGAYMIACVIGAALSRVRAGSSGPPVLLVLQEANSWFPDHLLAPYMDTLGRAGIAILRTEARLGADGERLLADYGTHWLFSLHPADVGFASTYLRVLGLDADLPVTALPRGVALVRVPSPGGAVAATAYAGGHHIPVAEQLEPITGLEVTA